jgi:hypothetical protein
MTGRVRINDKQPLKSVLSQIHELNPVQLREVEQKISVLKSLKPLEEDDQTKKEAYLFYDILLKGLNEEINFPMDLKFEYFKKNGPYKKLLEALSFINRFLENALGPNLSLRDKQRGYLLFTRLMIKHQKNSPIFAMSPTTILNCHQDFPTFVERSYPGYIKSGAFQWIFRPIQNPDDLNV